MVVIFSIIQSLNIFSAKITGSRLLFILKHVKYLALIGILYQHEDHSQRNHVKKTI